MCALPSPSSLSSVCYVCIGNSVFHFSFFFMHAVLLYLSSIYLLECREEEGRRRRKDKEDRQAYHVSKIREAAAAASLLFPMHACLLPMYNYLQNKQKHCFQTLLSSAGTAGIFFSKSSPSVSWLSVLCVCDAPQWRACQSREGERKEEEREDVGKSSTVSVLWAWLWENCPIFLWRGRLQLHAICMLGSPAGREKHV